METIDISSELERLDKHLAGNKRTILSAQFGDGKSYFLNEYVHTRGKEKLFITLHPVNYVVAPNEDIFEYIKRDILSFLSKQPEFKEVDWEKARKKILDYDTLLEECEFLSDAIPPAKILLTPFRLFKKVDNAYAIDKFFDRFASTKGGIFEQDEFTIAIQETIECIQQHGKECVLIIEDLDRIDPGHLFRILNVFGAHIDVDPDKNKFGFDNIILVLDYDVTRSIFHHFYGKDANYAGYMSKFLSHNIFEYSLLKQAHQVFMQYLKNQCLLDEDELKQLIIGYDNSGKGISVLPKIQALSVRDIVNIMDDVENGIISENRKVEDGEYNTLAPITRLLVIMTRLQVKMHKSEFERYFWKNPIRLSCLNVFLLETKGITYGVHVIDDQRYSIRFLPKEGEMKRVQVMEVYGGSSSNIKIPQAITLALQTAIQYVPDAQQLFY